MTDGIDVGSNMQSRRDMVPGSTGSILHFPEFPTRVFISQQQSRRRAVTLPLVLTANEVWHRISSATLDVPVLVGLAEQVSRDS